MTNKPNIKRLLKVAEHLEKKQFGNGKFNFNTIIDDFDYTKGCGTSACALGELPFIFPKSFKYVNNGQRQPTLELKGEIYYYFEAAEEFFNITNRQANRLFQPLETMYHSGKQSTASTKPETVAKNIRAFCKLVEDCTDKKYESI